VTLLTCRANWKLSGTGRVSATIFLLHRDVGQDREDQVQAPHEVLHVGERLHNERTNDGIEHLDLF
jgi:hypothetical protein